MRPRILALGLAILGLGLVLGAFILGSYNRGFCPEISGNPFARPALFGHSFCDHMMTFEGITFWISATAEKILVVGAIVLASSLAVGLYGMRRLKRMRQN